MDAMPTEIRSANPDGTQAIRRAATILRHVAQANSLGASLLELAKSVGLSRSTTHRILKCLVDEGLLEHDTTTHRYVVGAFTCELGLANANWMVETARWHEAVEAVARRTGVTAYLMRRSGFEAVCVKKAEGNSIIRAIPVEVGQRRMLGFGAGATALLSALDDPTCERIIEAITPSLERNGRLSPALLRKMIAETRSGGFAMSESNVYQDVFGLGMAIPAAAGPSGLAISIAVPASGVDEQRIADWKRVIREEILANLPQTSAG